MRPQLPMLALLCALLCLLAPQLASASKPHDVRVELMGEQQPTHVCIISTGTKDLESIQEDPTLNTLLKRRDKRWTIPTQVPDKPDKKPAYISHPETLGAAYQPLLGLVPEFSAYGDACGGQDSPTGCTPSFVALEGDEDRYIQCVESQSRAPGSTTHHDLRLLIVSIEALAAAPAELKDSVDTSIAVSEIKLFDSVLEFSSTHNPAVTTMLASVRGGYFREQSALRIDPGGATQLELEPRCAWMKLEKPQTLSSMTAVAGRDQFEVRVYPDPEADRTDELAEPSTQPQPSQFSDKDGVLGERCVRGDLDSTDLWVLVPAHVAKQTMIEVKLSSAEPIEADDRIVLRGQWIGAARKTLKLETHNFTFSWRADNCFYSPGGGCPEAFVHESGVRCRQLDKDDDKEICRYACPGDEGKVGVGDVGVGIEPGDLSIDFRTHSSPSEPKDVGQLWTRKLNYIDQQLVGHVDVSEQTVHIEIASANHYRRAQPSEPADKGRKHEWQEYPARLDTLGDQVYAVELEYMGSTGANTSVVIDLADSRELLSEMEEQGVLPVANVPQATCSNKIRYRYIGERSYVPGQVEIKSGRLPLQSPVELGREWYFVLNMAGGILVPRGPGQFGAQSNTLVYPMGSLEFGIANWPNHYRERDCDKAIEAGSVRSCRRAQAPGRGMRIEGRLALNYSTAAIQPIDPTGEAPSLYFQRVPYIRFGGGVTVLSPWFGRGGGKKATVSQREWRQFAIGGGLGGFWGRPLRQADTNLFDRAVPVDFSLRAHAEVRVRVSRRGHVELVMRHEYYFLEDNISFSTDGRGQPEQRLNTGVGFRQALVFGLSTSL